MRFVLFISALLTAVCFGQEVVLEEGGSKLIVSEHPLAEGALEVQLVTAVDYMKWKKDDFKTAYHLLQQAAMVWRDARVADDYLLQGKISSEPFRWQIAPYPDSVFKNWTLIKVLYRVVYGAPKLSEQSESRIASTMKEKLLKRYPAFIKDRSKDRRFDAFCDREIVNRQTVYSGKMALVLQDYAANRGSSDQLHLLVIPKACKKEFAELSEEEFLEIQELTQRMVSLFQEKGYPIAYLFSNNGPNSGQSVPHFHQHIVFVKDDPQGAWEKMNRFFAYLIPNRPLPREELVALVKQRRQIIEGGYEVYKNGQ